MLAQFPNFQKYSIQEALQFTKRVREFEPRCDLSPAYIPGYYNLDGKLSFCELNGNLVVSFTDPEIKQASIVIFGINKLGDSIREIFSFQKQHDMEERIVSLESAQVKHLRDDPFILESMPELDEYIISTKEHRDIKSKAVNAEARAVRNFMRAYGEDIKIFELDLSRHNSVELIINSWHAWSRYFKNNNNDPDLIERQYISLYLMHADELPTRNVVISHAGQIMAFGLYDIADGHSCAMFHSLKVDYAYNHAFDFGLHVIANKLYEQGIEYINVEEDLGIPGIRTKKNNLMPVKKLLRYSARPAL